MKNIKTNISVTEGLYMHRPFVVRDTCCAQVEQMGFIPLLYRYLASCHHTLESYLRLAWEAVKHRVVCVQCNTQLVNSLNRPNAHALLIRACDLIQFDQGIFLSSLRVVNTH